MFSKQRSGFTGRKTTPKNMAGEMKTGKIKGTRASYTYDVVYRQAPCKQSLQTILAVTWFRSTKFSLKKCVDVMTLK